jgi:hypothetical protein
MSKESLFALVLIVLAAACGGSTSNGDVSSGSSSSGSSSGSTGDGGDTTGDGTDGGTTNYDTPTVCTSQKTWTSGDRGSQSMHPGRACVSCHADNGGPRLTIAGTVFPTAHEPDDCNGTNAGSLKVVITDANGKVTNIAVNSVGNFYSATTIATPFNAKVVSANGERAMTASQTSGDCNSCHTVTGAKDAPGRIMAP